MRKSSPIKALSLILYLFLDQSAYGQNSEQNYNSALEIINWPDDVLIQIFQDFESSAAETEEQHQSDALIKFLRFVDKNYSYGLMPLVCKKFRAIFNAYALSHSIAKYPRSKSINSYGIGIECFPSATI